MALATVDMENCDKKKKCLSGVNEGLAYTPGSECDTGYTFNAGMCDCDPINGPTNGCCPGRARAYASFFDGTEVFNPSCNYQVFTRDEAVCGEPAGWFMRLTSNDSKEDCENGVGPTERDVYVGNDIGSNQYPGFTYTCNTSGSGECDSCPDGMYCDGAYCRFPAGQCVTVSSCDVVELERRDRTTGELSWLSGGGMRGITSITAYPGDESGDQRVDYDYIDCRGQEQSFSFTYQAQTAFYTGNWRLQGRVSPCECNADPQSNVLIEPAPDPLPGACVTRFLGAQTTFQSPDPDPTHTSVKRVALTTPLPFIGPGNQVYEYSFIVTDGGNDVGSAVWHRFSGDASTPTSSKLVSELGGSLVTGRGGGGFQSVEPIFNVFLVAHLEGADPRDPGNRYSTNYETALNAVPQAASSDFYQSPTGTIPVIVDEVKYFENESDLIAWRDQTS